jgi:hypothetical protein
MLSTTYGLYNKLDRIDNQQQRHTETATNMDVMQEINGLRSYDVQMALHNNEHWASHLANVILARPSVPEVS